MKILIVTPLFPPDTAPSACYSKELAERLQHENRVTVLLYGHLPEAVGQATLVCIDKRAGRAVRAWRFLRTLWRLAKEHDLVLIQNGPSVELPSLLVSLFTLTDVVLMESDRAALASTKRNPLLRFIYFLLAKRTTLHIKTTDTWPGEQPIMHPLKARPEQALIDWERSWQDHLESLFTRHIPS